jgi:hypothetical protein
MTTDEKTTLRADILAVLNPAMSDAALPLPPATPPGLSAEQKAILADNWVADIQTRRSESWTDLEKAAVRAAINRALKTL